MGQDRGMAGKPFASSADLGDGVYALTAEEDPNVGAVEGEAAAE
jgi:hypothetical protein